MSWGSWVLIIVYGVLLVSALIRLHEAWPWLGRQGARRSRGCRMRSPAIPATCGRSRGRTSASASGLGIYTGILLNTMVARPLWNTAILGPLFLFSGLSAGAAAVHLSGVLLRRSPAPQGMLLGAVGAMIQPLAPERPEPGTMDGLIRYDVAFLAVELVLIGLLLISLFTSTESHAVAGRLITSGPYAMAFWGIIVVAGVLVPIALQVLELRHTIPHTVLPAVLVLVGGFTLRWVMVNAGQASQLVANPGF